MNIEEFFLNVGGDFKDVSARLVSEKLILKYVKRFADDTSFNDLTSAFENKDVTAAFRAAHTLKGICSTLGLGTLYTYSAELTELLRNKDEADFEALEDILEKTKQSYTIAINCISSLD